MIIDPHYLVGAVAIKVILILNGGPILRLDLGRGEMRVTDAFGALLLAGDKDSGFAGQILVSSFFHDEVFRGGQFGARIGEQLRVFVAVAHLIFFICVQVLSLRRAIGSIRDGVF